MSARVRFAVDTTGMAAAAAVTARGPSPVVEAVDSGWGFVEAAHTLDWTVIPAPAGAPAENAPPIATHSIRLFQLMWLLSSFLVYADALLPARGLGIGLMDAKIDEIFAALEDVGGLEYSEAFDSDDLLLAAVSRAATQARSDPRLYVDDNPDHVFYLEPPAPAVNVATRAAFWMMSSSLSFFRGDDNRYTALSTLIRIFGGIALEVDRSLPASNYMCFSEELRVAAGGVSLSVAARVTITPATIASGSLSRNVMAFWVRCISSAVMPKWADDIFVNQQELDLAVVFASGGEAERRQANLAVLPRLLQLEEHSVLSSVVVDADNSTLAQSGLLEQLFLACGFHGSHLSSVALQLVSSRLAVVSGVIPTLTGGAASRTAGLVEALAGSVAMASGGATAGASGAGNLSGSDVCSYSRFEDRKLLAVEPQLVLLLEAETPSILRILSLLLHCGCVGVYCFILSRLPARINLGKTVMKASKFVGKLNTYCFSACAISDLGVVPDEAQSREFMPEFWDRFMAFEWDKISWHNDFVNRIDSVLNTCEVPVVPPQSTFLDLGKMNDLLDYFSKLLKALDFVDVGALSFSFNFRRILRILKRTDSLPLELRAANLQRVQLFTVGLFIQGAKNWKSEVVGVKNFDVARNREFLSSHDRVLLDLEEFENYKDKWKELRVNFGNVDPLTGGSLALAGPPQGSGLSPSGEFLSLSCCAALPCGCGAPALRP